MICAGTKVIPFPTSPPGARTAPADSTTAGEGEPETGAAEEIPAEALSRPGDEYEVVRYGEVAWGPRHLANASLTASERIQRSLKNFQDAVDAVVKGNFKETDSLLIEAINEFEASDRHGAVSSDALFAIIEAASTYAKELGNHLYNKTNGIQEFKIRILRLKKLSSLFISIRSRLALGPVDSFRFDERMRILNALVNSMGDFLINPSSSFWRLKLLAASPRPITVAGVVQRAIRESGNAGSVSLSIIPPYLTLEHARLEKLAKLISHLVGNAKSDTKMQIPLYIKIFFIIGLLKITYRSENPNPLNEGRRTKISQLCEELGIALTIGADSEGNTTVTLDIPDGFWNVDDSELFNPDRFLLGLGPKFAKFSHLAKEKIAAKILGLTGQAAPVWDGNKLIFSDGATSPITETTLNLIEAAGIRLRPQRSANNRMRLVFEF